MPEAIGVLVAALVGAATGAFATAYKSRKELESNYDIELRRRRIDTYAELWKLLEPLAKWSPPQPLTYGGVARLSRALRSWYFGSGGLFLSQQTRAPYFNLQEALTRSSKNRPRDDTTVLDEDTHEVLKALGSRLRTATTEDVATRVEPRLAGPFGSRLFKARRSALHIQVDRRWDFERRPPVAAFFLVLGNRSDEVLEIAKVQLDGTVVEVKSFPLQPGEERELTVHIEHSDPPPGETPTVTVTLASGKQVSSSETPDVPLRTPDLKRFAP